MVSGNISASELQYCKDENGAIRAKEFMKKPISLSDLENIIKQIGNKFPYL